MKVSDLKPEDIRIGLRIISLISDRQGTVVHIDHKDDEYSWVHWDEKSQATSGFYWNNCKCEVVVDENGKPMYVKVEENG